jgi:MFS family permease
LQFSFFGAFFLIPLYLQELRGVSPLQAGLWLVSVALSAAVVLPISGMLVDHFGAKWVIVFGVIALTFSSWWMAFYVDLSTPLGTLLIPFMVRGVALACILQPSNVVALSTVPRDKLPRASSLRSVLNIVAASLGTAVLATSLKGRELIDQVHLAPLQASMHAFDEVNLLNTLVAAAGIVIALLLRSRSRPGKEDRAVDPSSVKLEEAGDRSCRYSNNASPDED